MFALGGLRIGLVVLTCAFIFNPDKNAAMASLPREIFVLEAAKIRESGAIILDVCEPDE